MITKIKKTMKFSKKVKKGKISEMRSDNLHNSDFEKAKAEIIAGLMSQVSYYAFWSFQDNFY